VQLFPRGIVRKADRFVQRHGISRSCAAAQVSRHLHWVLAITERLAHRMTWCGIHPENMTLSLARRFWILLRDIAAGRPHPAFTILSPQTRERREPAARQFAHAHEWKLQILSPQLMTHGPTRNVAPTISAFVQNRVHTSTTVTLTQLVRSIEAAARLSLRESPLATGGERTFSPPPASSVVQSAIRPLHSVFAESDPEIGDIPARVQHRHRRVEQRPFLCSGDFADRLPTLRNAEQPVVVDKSQLRIRARADDELPFGHKPRGRASPAEPPVNIGRITDAVLQQLDRRLVAARERVGRI